MISHFDAEANKYDLWFESDRGHKIFALERGCLKRLFQGSADGWLEVGVGSGRFGASFGITNGVDPSLGMLKIASHRGVRAFCGVGEDLPFRNNAFDGILMVTTICFVANPQRTFSECYRTLQPSGKLVLGIVPKNSSWGRLYEKKGRERHPLYSNARFYSSKEIIEMCQETGLFFEQAANCLLSIPEDNPSDDLAEGIDESAGFVAMRFSK